MIEETSDVAYNWTRIMIMSTITCVSMKDPLSARSQISGEYDDDCKVTLVAFLHALARVHNIARIVRMAIMVVAVNLRDAVFRSKKSKLSLSPSLSPLGERWVAI